MKVYVASSWKNQEQPEVVSALREWGHEVYDFKDDGFSWAVIDPDWECWDIDTYMNALNHEAANRGFARDFCAMKWADVFVLVLPSGRSAHLEAGWALGQGKPTCILLSHKDFESDLMYKMADRIVQVQDLQLLNEWLKDVAPGVTAAVLKEGA